MIELIGDIIHVEMKLKGNCNEAKELSSTNGGCQCICMSHKTIS